MAGHPYNTDDAGVVPDRSFEIEASGGVDFLGSADGGLVIKYGVGDRFDLGVSFGALFPADTAHTLTRPSIGMKFNLIPDRLTLSAASALAEQDFSLCAILTGGFGKTSMHANIGFGSTEEESELLLFAGTIQQALGSWTVGAELFGDQLHTPLWQIGIAHTFQMPVVASLGLGGTLNSSDDLTITIGVTISIDTQETKTKSGHP